MPQIPVYLDYNATAPLLPEVAAALPSLASVFGNPSSPHAAGVAAHRRVESARATVAAFIGAEPGQVVFTSGATESNNTALLSVLDRSPHSKPHLIISAIEHPAVLEPAQALARTGRVDLELLPVDRSGRITLDDLERRIRPETALFSVMAANNEVGALQPIREATAIARRHGVPVHTDAAQLFGKLPVSVSELGVDFLSASGHKIGALKGVGVLYARKPASLTPLLRGGPQENGHRPGTENTTGILSLEIAVRAVAAMLKAESARLRTLCDCLLHGLRRSIPDTVLHTPRDASLPNTLNVSFPGCFGSALALSLADEGVCVSTTSACETGHRGLSHVLEAMGVEDSLNRSAVRFSLGHATTKPDIDRVLAVLPDLVSTLRSL